MDSPARRLAMGIIGRRRIETKLAGPFVIPKLLAMYQGILPRPEAAVQTDVTSVTAEV